MNNCFYGHFIPDDNLPRCLVKLPKPPKETGDCIPLASPNCSVEVVVSGIH